MSNALSTRIFLSAVTDEFESYRLDLTQSLQRTQHVEVKVQESFGNAGKTLFEQLDEYIQDCAAVVHLLGDMTGSCPPYRVVERFLDANEAINDCLPALRKMSAEALAEISYTQWEAYLGIYRKRPVHVYLPDPAAPRGARFQPDESSRIRQRQHHDRLRDAGHFCPDGFLDPDKLSKFVLADLTRIVTSSAFVLAATRGASEAPRPNWEFVTPDDFRFTPEDGRLKRLNVGDQPNLTFYRDRQYMPRPGAVTDAVRKLRELIENRDKEAEADYYDLDVFWIGGRSGAGKSVLLLQVMEAMCQQGHKVIWLKGDTSRFVEVIDGCSPERGVSPAFHPDLIFIDDLYRPGGLQEAQLAAVRQKVADEPSHRWPVVVTCGPPEFQAQFSSACVDRIKVHPWKLGPVGPEEAEELHRWFARRSHEPFEAQAAFRQEEGLLISMAFELRHGGLEAFSRRFCERLNASGLAAPLTLTLALNRLYISAPGKWLTEEDWERLKLFNEAADFSIDEQRDREYLRLTHPHLSDAIYRQVVRVNNPRAFANDLFEAIRLAWQTDLAVLCQVLRLLANGNERLDAVDLPHLARRLGSEWQKAAVEATLIPGSTATDIAMSLACWQGRQPELNLDEHFGVSLLSRARCVIRDAGPDWLIHWKRLREAYPTNEELTQDALVWLSADENSQSPGWYPVWRMLLTTSQGEAYDSLVKRALEQLKKHPTTPGSGVVLEQVLEIVYSDRKPARVGFKEFYAIVLKWLEACPGRKQWFGILETLLDRTDIPEPTYKRLIEIGITYLQSLRRLWPPQALLAAILLPKASQPTKVTTLALDLSRWLKENLYHTFVNPMVKLLRSSPILTGSTPPSLAGWEKLWRWLNWREKSLLSICEAGERGKPLRGTITKPCKGGYCVELKDPAFTAFLPFQINFGPGDATMLLGRELGFFVRSTNRVDSVVLGPIWENHERQLATLERCASIRPGEIVEATVERLLKKSVLLDLQGSNAYLPYRELYWDPTAPPVQGLQPGDQFLVRVTKVESDVGNITVSQRLVEKDWAEVKAIHHVGSVDEAIVVHFEVEQAAYAQLRSGWVGKILPEEFSWPGCQSNIQVGQKVNVAVIELDGEEKKIKLSLKQAQPNPWERVAERYPPGTIVSGVVRKLMNYGAFVELEEGLSALLHVSDMSWLRKVSHPSEVVQIDDRIDCVVTNVDLARNRLALGLKQRTIDPWINDIPNRFQPNQTHTGKVASTTQFGVFIELEPGLQGLLHVSELAEGEVGRHAEVFQVGSEVEVRILRVDATERRIGLSRKELAQSETIDPQGVPDSCPL